MTTAKFMQQIIRYERMIVNDGSESVLEEAIMTY